MRPETHFWRWRKPCLRLRIRWEGWYSVPRAPARVGVEEKAREARAAKGDGRGKGESERRRGRKAEDDEDDEATGERVAGRKARASVVGRRRALVRSASEGSERRGMVRPLEEGWDWSVRA